MKKIKQIAAIADMLEKKDLDACVIPFHSVYLFLETHCEVKERLDFADIIEVSYLIRKVFDLDCSINGDDDTLEISTKNEIIWVRENTNKIPIEKMNREELIEALTEMVKLSSLDEKAYHLYNISNVNYEKQ